MNKIILAAALSFAAILPFATTPAFAGADDKSASLCTVSPAKAAQAGIDCAETSAIVSEEETASRKYPASPVSFGSGIIF